MAAAKKNVKNNSILRAVFKQEDCFCGISDFYELAAKRCGLKVRETDCFDCRKICVSPKVQDEIIRFYENKGADKTTIGMALMMSGPKANIEDGGYIAEIENGFITA